MSSMSKSTAYEYFRRLSNFKTFVLSKYKITVDEIIKKINEVFDDPYDTLSNYSLFMQNSGNISVLTLKLCVVTVLNYIRN
jgi:hypothetical protein